MVSKLENALRCNGMENGDASVKLNELLWLLLTKHSCKHFFLFTSYLLFQCQWLTNDEYSPHLKIATVKISTKCTPLGFFKTSGILKSQVLYCRRSSVLYSVGGRGWSGWGEAKVLPMQNEPQEAISLQLKPICSFFLPLPLLIILMAGSKQTSYCSFYVWDSWHWGMILAGRTLCRLLVKCARCEEPQKHS